MHPLINAIRNEAIGASTTIPTPFGEKPMVYADYTASGRSLGFIERFIQESVLPFYANTHTESSYTGSYTGNLREQSRNYIREAVNAQDNHRVIFCGSGATAAIHKLIDMLNLRLPADLDERYQLQQQIPANERPIVFIGPYEHHSNELPWRESIADVISIPLDANGMIDINILEEKIQKYQDRALKMASFSAASNVTGIKTELKAIGELLHQYGVLSFWDYAAAGPYVEIDMADNKDAVFLSPHKFIGGPNTSGVLVVSADILNNRVPAVTGGGTVMYVTPETHRYTPNIERREEAGTPDIIASIRTGLVFKLQQDVGTDTIEERETDFIQRALTQWGKHPQIDILGNTDAPRLAIVSFRIREQDSESSRELHYGLVVALLNDLFGIQARGGCSCAGPYGHHLLGLTKERSEAIEQQLLQGGMILRPGWVRLSFNYFIDEATFNYLIQAVELIAEHGWNLLPYYDYDTTSGTWRYQGTAHQPPVSLKALDLLSLCEENKPQEHVNISHTIQQASPTFAEKLEQTLHQATHQLTQQNGQAQQYKVTLNQDAEGLRWFTT